MTPFAMYKWRRNQEIWKITCQVFAQRRSSKREAPDLHLVRVYLYGKRREAESTSGKTHATCNGGG